MKFRTKLSNIELSKHLSFLERKKDEIRIDE